MVIRSHLLGSWKWWRVLLHSSFHHCRCIYPVYWGLWVIFRAVKLSKPIFFDHLVVSSNTLRNSSFHLVRVQKIWASSWGKSLLRDSVRAIRRFVRNDKRYQIPPIRNGNSFIRPWLVSKDLYSGADNSWAWAKYPRLPLGVLMGWSCLFHTYVVSRSFVQNLVTNVWVTTILGSFFLLSPSKSFAIFSELRTLGSHMGRPDPTFVGKHKQFPVPLPNLRWSRFWLLPVIPNTL